MTRRDSVAVLVAVLVACGASSVMGYNAGAVWEHVRIERLRAVWRRS